MFRRRIENEKKELEKTNYEYMFNNDDSKLSPFNLLSIPIKCPISCRK